MTDWQLVSEPTGRTYAALLRACAELCDSFSFHTTGMRLDPSAEVLIEDLRPYLHLSEETAHTPGSVFATRTVNLARYRLTPDSLALLIGAADGLYAWAEPMLPNDIAMHAGGRSLLVTLGSDELAYLSLTEEELAAFRDSVPDLQVSRMDS